MNMTTGQWLIKKNFALNINSVHTFHSYPRTKYNQANITPLFCRSVCSVIAEFMKLQGVIHMYCTLLKFIVPACKLKYPCLRNDMGVFPPKYDKVIIYFEL